MLIDLSWWPFLLCQIPREGSQTRIFMHPFIFAGFFYLWDWISDFLDQFICLVSSLIFLRLFGLGLFDHSDLNFQISMISWAIWKEVSYFSRLLRNTQRSKWCVLDFLVPSSNYESIYLKHTLYLSFFFTRAKFLENKIYTEKRQFFALNL